MDDSVLFQLPPELLCGLLSKLPGEDLKQFGNSFETFLTNQNAGNVLKLIFREIRMPFQENLYTCFYTQGV